MVFLKGINLKTRLCPKRVSFWKIIPALCSTQWTNSNIIVCMWQELEYFLVLGPSFNRWVLHLVPKSHVSLFRKPLQTSWSEAPIVEITRWQTATLQISIQESNRNAVANKLINSKLISQKLHNRTPLPGKLHDRTFLTGKFF